MNRSAKLLLLGQQQFERREQDGEIKRKTISPGKENPTPSLSKRNAAGQVPDYQDDSEPVVNENGKETFDFVTPQQQESKTSRPVLQEKGLHNNELFFTNEWIKKYCNAREEKKSKKSVQRNLFSSSDTDLNRVPPPQMKSGIKLNCMTNIGVDTPPSSQLGLKELQLKTAGISNVQDTCTIPPDIPRSNSDPVVLATELPESIEENRVLTVCARRKTKQSPGLASDTGSVLPHQVHTALPKILDVDADEDTTDICDSESVKLSTSTSLEAPYSPDQDFMDEASTRLNKISSSFSSDCLQEAEVLVNNNEGSPKANLTDADKPTSVSEAAGLKAKSSKLLTPDKSNEDSAVNDNSSLLVDLQDAGVDVAEELIVMTLSPLNITEDQEFVEEEQPNPTIGLTLEENDQNDPDDPDFVVDDPTAPQNQSGLESNDEGNGGSPKPRRRNPNGWKKNVRKQKNAKGLEHVTATGKKKAARDVIPEGCKEDCKRKCHNLVTLEQRQQINKNYWSIGDSSRQWDYLSRHVRVLPVQRRTVNLDDPYRKHSYAYFFTVANEQVQVCQIMFLKTFNISAMRVRLAMKKMLSKDGVISPDKREKTGNRRRIHPSTIGSIVAHIESYPTYESHYCRRSSRKRYLDEKLDVSKMFRNYSASRPAGMAHTATKRQYEDIFRAQFKHKLGFYKPKKDQCGVCLRWKGRSPEDKLNETEKAKFEKHINNKTEARRIKDENIKLAQNDSKICVASYDLQKVFFCPYGENGEYIFRRKLRCYNLSIFQSVSKIGYCYVWDETAGKKGAAEVSSCVWSFIEQKVEEGYKVFYFVSDNCWNQNKNGLLFAMYNMASIKFGVEINHTYFEKGHTQMECDSIHSLIERRCKKQTICSPQAWYGVIRTAKVPSKKKGLPYHPYVVKVMTKETIFDFRAVLSEQNLAKIPKSKVRQIKICENVAKYRREFDGPEEEVNMLKKRTGRPINFKTYQLKQMYSKRIPLKPEQLKDLLWLCNEKHIPEPDCQFFYSLDEDEQLSDLPSDDEDGSSEEEDESANDTVTDDSDDSDF